MINVDRLIQTKIFVYFVKKAWETIEFKDNLEYSVEKLQSLLKKLSFIELVSILKKKKLNDKIADEFLSRHSKITFRKG